MKISINGEELAPAAVEFEFNRLIRFFSEYLSQPELQAQTESLRQKAVEQAIGAKLLLDEAEKLDLEPDEADIDDRMRRMEQDAGGAERFRENLRRQRLTPEGVRSGLRRGRRVDLLIDRIAGDVPDPTEEDMREHFASHAGEYAAPRRIRAQHILIRPASGSEEDHREARARLQGICRSIADEGADFSDMAAEHSDCPSGKSKGGSLGWFGEGMLVPGLDQVVFALDIGEISGILASPLGYHLFKKLEAEEARPAEYAEVADRVRDFLRHARRGEIIAEHVKELRARADIRMEA
jgi:parvulin-like peptidyl-prolyl isomerase